jgi:hypothetical protein
MRRSNRSSAPVRARIEDSILMRTTLPIALASLLSVNAGIASAQAGAVPSPAPGAISVGAEGIAWWFKNSPTPTPIIVDGVYGRADTNVLLGGGDVDTGTHPGFRISASYAVNPQLGIEGNFFYADRRSKSAGVQSSGVAGSTDLLLPFVDAVTQRESVTEISFSPVYAGSASLELDNRLMGAEVDAAWPLPSAQQWNARFLAGFRWLRLDERYTITTSSAFIAPLTPDIWNTTDRFDTTNNFYGAQIGADARYEADHWFASGAVKVGVGAMVEDVSIGGSLVTDDFSAGGPAQTFTGGYFALPTNIGNRSHTAFAVVPEVQLRVGYRFTPSASVFLSYRFLYASDVVRPGDQINRTVNQTQSVSYTGEPPATLRGPAQPSFSFNRSDFWAQGVGLGLEVRF